MLRIRSEIPADISAIRRVNELAFGQPNEARLVDALRQAARPFLSLLAEIDAEIAGGIVGHVCFSPVEVERSDGRKVEILGLAPMAVLPERQNQGIGSKLVEAGLAACREAG